MRSLGLEAAILKFWLPASSDNVRIRIIEFYDPENFGVAIVIMLLQNNGCRRPLSTQLITTKASAYWGLCYL